MYEHGTITGRVLWLPFKTFQLKLKLTLAIDRASVIKGRARQFVMQTSLESCVCASHLFLHRHVWHRTPLELCGASLHHVMQFADIRILIIQFYK